MVLDECVDRDVAVVYREQVSSKEDCVWLFMADGVEQGCISGDFAVEI